MKTKLAFFRGKSFRTLITLSSLASAALVLEAAQRWK
ncbi:MAG: hypothetical protein QOF49_2268 [Chloroflexota bacterium]|jgi:hypothetical protein|nr:hypothetical protein [Chloroflexota bacterium]